MDIKDALKGQYHAAFRMLANCVEKCPDEMWVTDEMRPMWKIAYHAAFFGHFYMCQGESSFTPRYKDDAFAIDLYGEEKTPREPFSRAELLDYIEHIRGLTNETIDSLDLDTDDPGFPWYKNINKLEHELMSIRHIQGHVGQMSERLMAAGIDTDWIARRA